MLAAMSNTTQPSGSSSDDNQLGPVIPPAVLFGTSQSTMTHVYNDLLRLRRELDYMFVQVDTMAVKLDTMTAEVADLRKFRADVEAKLAHKCSL